MSRPLPPAPVDLATSRRAAWILLALAALPWLPSLFAPLFADDYLHIERLALLREGRLVEALRSWILRASDMGAWWAPPGLAVPYFRPLITLSFFLDHALWRMLPFGYHLTNLLLHLAATRLALSIARRLLGDGLPAFAATALFALHPCHSEAVAWVSGRTDLIAGTLTLGALGCHLRGLASARRGAWLAAGLGCFALALCAKEIAIALPAIVLAHGLSYRREEPIRARLAAPLAYGALALAYLGLRVALLGVSAPPAPFAHAPFAPGFLGHLAMALPLYLGDLVLFVPADPVVTAPFWALHPALFALFVGVALLTFAGSLRDARNHDPRAAAFGTTFALLALLPALPITVGERFLYLPSLGYCLVVGAKLPRRAATSAERRAIGALLALVLAVALGKSVAMAILSRNSRVAIDDALAEIDRRPSVREVYAVDLPAASALAFPHALRVERPARGLAVDVLSITPTFLSAAPFASTLQTTGDELRLRSDGGWLGSYLERAFLAGRTLSNGESIHTARFEVQILDVDSTRLRGFLVRFPAGAPPRLVLRGQGFRLGAVEEASAR